MTPKTEANPEVIIRIENSQVNPRTCADVTLFIDGIETRQEKNLNIFNMVTVVTDPCRRYPAAEIIDTATEEDPTAEIHPCLIDDASENPRVEIHREINASMPRKPRQVEKPAGKQPDPYNDQIIESQVHRHSTLA